VMRRITLIFALQHSGHLCALAAAKPGLSVQLRQQG
jgi:hypothetical protein